MHSFNRLTQFGSIALNSLWFVGLTMAFIIVLSVFSAGSVGFEPGTMTRPDRYLFPRLS